VDEGIGIGIGRFEMSEIEVGKVYVFNHLSLKDSPSNGKQVVITEVREHKYGHTKSYRGHLVGDPEATGIYFAEELTPVDVVDYVDYGDGEDDGGAPVEAEPESYTVHPVWNLRVVALQAAAQTFQGEGVRTSEYVIDRAEDFLAWLQEEQA